MNPETIARMNAPNIRHQQSVVIGILSGLLMLALNSPAAQAVWYDAPENGQPGALRLATDNALNQWPVLPGETISWAIQIRLEGPTSGTLNLELRGLGEIIEDEGLLIEVQSCDETLLLLPPFYTCNGTLQNVIPVTEFALIADQTQSGIWSLQTLYTGQPQSILVELTIPTSADVENKTAQIGLGFMIGGPDEPTLPDTGQGSLTLIFVAIALLLIGTTLATASKVRKA
ncbi:MAG: hypothetical protein WBA28_09665 [Microbacteriaceae bacterium]